jgi:hypothetical protein
VAWTTGIVFPLLVAVVASILTAVALDRGEVT